MGLYRFPNCFPELLSLRFYYIFVLEQNLGFCCGTGSGASSNCVCVCLLKKLSCFDLAVKKKKKRINSGQSLNNSCNFDDVCFFTCLWSPISYHSDIHGVEFFTSLKTEDRASLVAQWLRFCLPMQETWVRAVVWEDPTCCGTVKPVHHNY